MSKWSQKLDEYLAINRISKKQLAFELGVSINTIQKWWGNREPSQEHAVKIKHLLDNCISDTTTKAENRLAPVERTVEGDEMVENQIIKQGERVKERAVIISLHRTKCPLCNSPVAQFKQCEYCGQHFVWANIPLNES